MKHPKIVVIGAGSASFGLSVLGKLLLEPGLAGSRLGLVDIDGEGLEKIERLANRANREWNSGFTIEANTDRTAILPEADFVVLSIAIDREKCWRKDFDIARKYGIDHYAENGGPGAFPHTARNLAVVMPILRDIESICPDAWLLNFTNPVPRICLAATKYTTLKTIGICHQIGFGYMMLGNFLSQDYGIEIPKNYRFRWDDPKRHETSHGITDIAIKKFDVFAAGLNHFTWMLGIRDRLTGEDLYPLLMQRLETHDPGFEPLTQEVTKLFGVMPVSGDCHMCEYLPYSHNAARKVWEHYDIQMYDLDLAEQGRDKTWAQIDRMASGAEPIDSLRSKHTERAEKIIAAIANNSHTYEEAINIPNKGHITNLPEASIVEVPGTVSAHGAHGIAVGNLPEPIAELCRRQVHLAELVVEASVEGDPTKALHALAMDPMVDDPRVAKALLDEYLTEFADYLPQFKSA